MSMNKSKQKGIALAVAVLNSMIYDVTMLWHKEMEEHTGKNMESVFNKRLKKHVDIAMNASKQLFEVISVPDKGLRKSINYTVCKELLLEFQKAMAELQQIDKKHLNEDGSFKSVLSDSTIDDFIEDAS